MIHSIDINMLTELLSTGEAVTLLDVRRGVFEIELATQRDSPELPFR